jgi:hypothetical protein
MGLLDKLFGKKSESRSVAEDRARQQSVQGKGIAQTSDEQDATRARMEAELEGQRDRQGKPPAPAE